MRKILYRGKLKREINPQKQAGDWVYGNFLDHWKDGACILEKGACIGVCVDPETVGEFTGLLDKNGVKIFEGDIIELDIGKYGKIRGPIKWSEKECAFMAITKHNSPHSLAHVNENPEAVEVLGNIQDKKKFGENAVAKTVMADDVRRWKEARK
jgi:uncharacterized phage protein (TIGR01671 family)